MTNARALIPAWLDLARISMRSISAYRFEYYSYLIWMVIRLFMLRAVWLAIYDDRESLNGISAETQVIFLTITSLQGYMLGVHLSWFIQGQVTTGQVALNLIRPLGFIPQLLAQQVGRTVGYIPFLLLLIPPSLLIGSLRVTNPANLLPYAVSLVLAYVIAVLISLLVGMLAFWIMHVNGLRVIISLISDFLGGALVPMWFMPDGLRTVLEFLPFQASLFLPAAIFTGEIAGRDLVQPFVVQLVWIVVLWWLAAWVWHRAERRVVIQGG